MAAVSQGVELAGQGKGVELSSLEGSNGSPGPSQASSAGHLHHNGRLVLDVEGMADEESDAAGEGQMDVHQRGFDRAVPPRSTGSGSLSAAPRHGTPGSRRTLRLYSQESGSTGAAEEVSLPGSVLTPGGRRARQRTSVDAAVSMLQGHEEERATAAGNKRRRRSLFGGHNDAPAAAASYSRGASLDESAYSLTSLHGASGPTREEEKVLSPGASAGGKITPEGRRVEKASPLAQMVSPTRGNMAWRMIRAAVKEDVHVDDSAALRDVLQPKKGASVLSPVDSRALSDTPHSTRRRFPRSSESSDGAASVGAAEPAKVGRLHRWCCAPVKPAIPAGDRQTVRAVVYELPVPGLVDPECRFAALWQALKFVIILAQAVCVPFRAAFDYRVTEEQWLPGLSGTDIGFYALDALYIADMIVALRTGFIEHGNKVMDRVRIRRRALRMPHFFFEVVSVLPYDIALSLFPGSFTGICLFCTRYTRLLRCRHLPRLFARAEGAGGIHSRNLFQVLKMLTFVLLLVHVQGCIWFRLSKMMGFAPPGLDADESFLAPASLREESMSIQYISAVYWAVREATSEGIAGAPHPWGALENVLSVFVTMSGILLGSYLIGAVARLVSQFDASWARHTERLSQMRRFLAHNGLSEDLGQEITAFYEFSFEESGGRDIQEVASTLSLSLQGQLAVFMTHDILRKVPLFASVEEGFVVSLAKTLTSMTVQRGELVMRAGLPCKRVFLVHWGSLSVEVGGSGDMNLMRKRKRQRQEAADRMLQGAVVKSPWGERLLLNTMRTKMRSGVLEDDEMHEEERRQGRVIELLSAGSFFGQYVAESKGYIPSTSVRANTFCILYALEHETLTEVMPRFPKSKKKVERALMRQRRRSMGATSARRRSSERSVTTMDSSLWAIVAALKLIGRVRRRTPTLFSRLLKSRVVRQSPCAWLTRDCFIRHRRRKHRARSTTATASSPADSPAGEFVLSPKHRLNSPGARVHRMRSSSGTRSRSTRVKEIWQKAQRIVRSIAAPNYEGARPDDPVRYDSSGSVNSDASGTAMGRGSSSSARASKGNVAFMEEPRDGPRVLNPDSHFRWTWQSLMQMSVLYNIVSVPIRVAFSKTLVAHSNPVMATMDVVVDVLYLMDLFVKARMAFYVRGVLITDPRALLHTYVVNGGFWRDVISSIPLDWIVEIAWWTRLNKLARASRLLVWFRTWMTQLTAASAQAVGTTLLQLVFLLLMSFHYLICLYWVFATASRNSHPLWPNDTFSAPLDLDDDGLAVQYFYSAYRVAHPGGLMRAAAPPTGTAAVYCLVVTVYGLFLFAYVIGALGSAIADTDASAAAFRARKLAVERFMAMRRVPEGMRDLVSHWFRVEWQSNNGLSVDALCSELPRSLARRLRFELCGDKLRHSHVFATLDSRSLAQLAEVIRIEMLAEGQVIFHSGELGADLFVIVGGAVSLYFGHDAGRLIQRVAAAVADASHSQDSRVTTSTTVTSPADGASRSCAASGDQEPERTDADIPPEMSDPFTTSGPGDIVGEFAYFEGVRLTTAIAVCATEVYVVSYGALHDLLDRMPFLEARIRLVARRKLVFMSRLVDDIYARHHQQRCVTSASKGSRQFFGSSASRNPDSTAAASTTTESCHEEPRSLPRVGVAAMQVDAPDYPGSVAIQRRKQSSMSEDGSTTPLGGALSVESAFGSVGAEADGSVGSNRAAAGDTDAKTTKIDSAVEQDDSDDVGSLPPDIEREAAEEVDGAARLSKTWRPPSFAESGSLAAVHFGKVAATRFGLDPHGTFVDVSEGDLIEGEEEA